jgi:hypothetical protein
MHDEDQMLDSSFVIGGDLSVRRLGFADHAAPRA